jgi:hypothetical protein
MFSLSYMLLSIHCVQLHLYYNANMRLNYHLCFAEKATFGCLDLSKSRTVLFSIYVCRQYYVDAFMSCQPFGVPYIK